MISIKTKTAAALIAALSMLQAPGASAFDNTWNRLKIGGGGRVDGLSVPAGTGVRFARTDAGGAYVWSQGQWQLLLKKSNLPSTDFNPLNNHGVVVDEIQGCNNDSTCAYMLFGGYIFRSSNINTTDPSGITWCRASGNVAQQTADQGQSDAFLQRRNDGPLMAVDPNNKNHVIWGTSASGIWETWDGNDCGTTTWTQISTSSIPLSSTLSTFRGYRIAFDPRSTIACPGHTGSQCSVNVYIYSSNATTPGVYKSGDGGATYALTTGGPTTVGRMKMSYASAGGGNLWVTDGAATNTPWRLNTSGTWLKMSGFTSGISAIAIDPLNGDHVVANAGSKFWVSTNGSGTTPLFTGYAPPAYAAGSGAGAAAWQPAMSVLLKETGSDDVEFDPLNSGSMIATIAQGVWTTNFLSGAPTWNAMVDGIEELLLTGKAEVTKPGVVTFGAQDQGSCQVSVLYNAAFNSAGCGYFSANTFLQYLSGLSQLPDRSLMFGKASQDANGGFDYSGISTDGFLGNYVPLNKWAATVPLASLANNGSNLIRATVPTTASLTTWSAGAGSIVCGVSGDPTFSSGIPQHCWPVTVVDGTHIDLQGSSYTSGVGTTAAILFVPATALNSWAHAGTITNVTSDAGVVQVTMQGKFLMQAGWPVCISGVTMNTTSVVNGCWISKTITNNNQTFDLTSSTFVGGDSYNTGGVARFWGAPGGGIAAASSSNWTMYGANNTFPMCTDDSGSTYTQVNAPTPYLGWTTVNGGPYAAGSNVFTVVDGTKVPLTVGTQAWIPLVSGRLWNTGTYTVSVNTVTTANVIPPGDSIATGATIGYQNSGWNNNAILRLTAINTDQVTPNTFYGLNTQFGLLKWTHCGTPVLVTDTGNNAGFQQWTFNGTLRAVPGEAGHLFYVAGPQGTGDDISATTSLQRTCMANNSTYNSVTWHAVTGFFGPHAVGFGAPKPGSNYPSIYVAGFYDAGGVRANAVFGIWRSVDDGSHGSTTTCTDGTWQAVGTTGWDFLSGWPVNPIIDVKGDPDVYGAAYLAGPYGAWWTYRP